ncbi:DUF1571 domain-containing protein [Planctomicrobium sp. SH668]|uniref:DUF1571 domain-containing protein n=1 Tax=Planctomicrobium sp. SH668 TaxID=3448126 RepID=UPI003F5B6CEF
MNWITTARLATAVIIVLAPASIRLAISSDEVVAEDKATVVTANKPTIRESDSGVIKNTLALPGREPQNHTQLIELKSFLKRSLEAISSKHGYVGTLQQQVKKGDVLHDVELIDFKLQRAPFSVYMKWQVDGQEVLYVEGQNNGRLLAHPTRGITAFRNVWFLKPDSPQAMQKSRYPLTNIGIEKLTQTVNDFYQTSQAPVATCEILRLNEEDQGDSVITFQVDFKSQEHSPEYARSRISFDADHHYLIKLENFEWNPEGGEPQILDSYRYNNIEFVEQFESDDFDAKSNRYGFYP